MKCPVCKVVSNNRKFRSSTRKVRAGYEVQCPNCKGWLKLKQVHHMARVVSVCIMAISSVLNLYLDNGNESYLKDTLYLIIFVSSLSLLYFSIYGRYLPVKISGHKKS